MEYYNRTKKRNSNTRRLKDRICGISENILKSFLSLDEESLEYLFNEYGKLYGYGAEEYARSAYSRWKSGRVKLAWRTQEKLLKLVPEFIDTSERKDLVKTLYDKYKPKFNKHIRIATDKTKDSYRSIVQAMDEYKKHRGLVALPSDVCDLLTWVNNSDMIAVREILSEIDHCESIKIEEIAEREIERARVLIENRKISTGEMEVVFPNGVLLVQFSRPSMFSRIVERVRSLWK